MKLLFTKEHEWVGIEEGSKVVKVGISTYGQDSLGDIVYIDVPEQGKSVSQGDDIAVVESAKAASDVYAPVSGTVVEVNAELESNPALINESAQDKGWIFSLEISEESELAQLMSEVEYAEFVKE